MPRQVVDNAAKRLALNVRTTEALRGKLEAAAMKSGRVLSQEVDSRLTRSFDLEADLALQDEIKAEMRGTIAALEARIALMEERNRTLYPDGSARALGRAFALALTAARHASGRDWREDAAAPAIVAGVVRRLMDRCIRGGESGSMAVSLLDKGRVVATADSIATTLADNLAEAMPPLPPLQPQDNPANWTSRAHTAVTFRDRATGKLLEVVHGPEFDLADAEADRGLGPKYLAAIERFRPISDTINAEDFIVHALKDGSTSWERLSGAGGKVHVPAEQDAPPAVPAKPQVKPPVARRVGPEEAARDFTPVDDPKRPAKIFEGHDHADLGMEVVSSDPDDTSDEAPGPALTKRGRKTKTPASV